MIQLEPQDRGAIEPLFANHTDSLVRSCMQGYFGNAWVDHMEHPTCARIIVASFCFFAGDPVGPAAISLVMDMPYGFSILVPPDDAWKRLVTEAWGDRAERVIRYAFARDDSGFHKPHLQNLRQRLPVGFTLRRFDAEVARLALAEGWSESFCDNFADADDFLRRGRGWAVMKDGALVSGCSSYTSYREGIEIQVATRDEYQRMGLASACSAALILECLDEGLFPHWDAASDISCRLAKSLGYRASGEYEAFVVIRRQPMSA